MHNLNFARLKVRDVLKVGLALVFCCLPCVGCSSDENTENETINALILAISQNEQQLKHIYTQATYKSESWDAEKNTWTDGGDGKIKAWHMNRPGSRMKLDLEQRTRWIDGPAPFSRDSLMEAYNGRVRKILFRRTGNPKAPDTALRGQVEANRSDAYDAFTCGWRCSLFGVEDKGRRAMRVSEYFTLLKETSGIKLSASLVGERDEFVEVVYQQPRGGKQVYRFDPSRGYALMHKSSWTADGTKTYEMSIEELAEPVPGVYYPRRAWRRGFNKDGTPRHRTEYVAEEIIANDSSTTDETYDFNWPMGTTVHDKVADVVYQAGVNEKETAGTISTDGDSEVHAPRLWWVVLALLAGVALVVVLMSRKRRAEAS